MESPKLRILIVEDEPFQRQAVRVRLTRAGYLCDEADDGTAALNLARASEYDGVVTDLRMPGTNGHELCTELLAFPKPPAVIVVTGIGDVRLHRDLLRRGVSMVLTKPVNYDRDIAAIRHVLEARARTMAEFVALPVALPEPSRVPSPILSFAAPVSADATAAVAEPDNTPEATDALAAVQPPVSEVRAASSVSEAMILPTFFFAAGTGFGWALHFISTSWFLGR